MEIIIGLIGFFTTIGGFGEALNMHKPNKYRIIGVTIGLAAPLLFITIWIVGNIYATDKITTHTNVLEYKNIVYSVPKQIIEIKTVYPWWSIREDTKYKAIIK